MSPSNIAGSLPGASGKASNAAPGAERTISVASFALKPSSFAVTD